VVPTNNNDEDNSNDDMNWKVAEIGKKITPFSKAKQHEHGEPNGSSGDQNKR
jgi:hypothetical protein